MNRSKVRSAGIQGRDSRGMSEASQPYYAAGETPVWVDFRGIREFSGFYKVVLVATISLILAEKTVEKPIQHVTKPNQA